MQNKHSVNVSTKLYKKSRSNKVKPVYHDFAEVSSSGSTGVAGPDPTFYIQPAASEDRDSSDSSGSAVVVCDVAANQPSVEQLSARGVEDPMEDINENLRQRHLHQS